MFKHVDCKISIYFYLEWTSATTKVNVEPYMKPERVASRYTVPWAEAASKPPRLSVLFLEGQLANLAMPFLDSHQQPFHYQIKTETWCSLYLYSTWPVPET